MAPTIPRAAAGARALAFRIAHASLVVHPAMGHDLPAQLWATIADAMVAHAVSG